MIGINIIIIALVIICSAHTYCAKYGNCFCEPISCHHVTSIDELVSLGNTVKKISCISKNKNYISIQGELNSSITNLRELTWLHIEGADLGYIPDEIGELSSLK